jgi:hypothetical protein
MIGQWCLRPYWSCEAAPRSRAPSWTHPKPKDHEPTIGDQACASQQKRTGSRLLALAFANRQMALPEIAPRGRHMLHTMNSTNVMPISSTNKATQSYSSQCLLAVIMSFHPRPFSWF